MQPEEPLSPSIREFDLDMIEEVRSTWQFYRDRRPETYGKMIEL